MDAKALIEEIRTEKRNAVASGILREEKPLAVITDKEKPRELPEGWQWCRLGDYAMKVTDYVASGSFASLKENVLITNEENYAVMVKTADFSNGFTKNLTYTDEHGYKFLENSNLYGGELILSNIGSIGKVFIVPDLHRPMTLASNTVMIRMTHNEYNKYMYYMFLSPFGQKLLMSISSGTSMLKFNKSQLKSTVIPVAPLEQQFQICNTLDRVQKIITHRKAELEKLDDLIKARFVEMFGTIHDNKFAYRIMTIQDVCEPIKDGTHQTPEYTNDDENGFKFLSSKDVTSGKIDWNHLKYIPEKLHKELYSRIAPRRGDLLLAKNGTTGIAAIVDRDEVFDIYVSLALLRPTIVDSIYLWGAINSTETKEQFDASLKGIGVPNLHLGEIKKTRIIVPPIEKQQEYATFVSQIDKSKSVIQKSLDETRLLFDSLMQKYFG